MASGALAQTPLHIEDLGEPVVRRTLQMRCVTRDAAGAVTAWAAQESAGSFGLVGIALADGAMTFADTTKFGIRHIQMISAANGCVYAFTGVPGRLEREENARHGHQWKITGRPRTT